MNLTPKQIKDQDVILSEEFGRTFWLNDVDELCSAPTFKNGETHWEQWDYVSDWTDLEGINLDSLLDIHKKLVLKNYIETTEKFNFRYQILKETNNV